MDSTHGQPQAGWEWILRDELRMNFVVMNTTWAVLKIKGLFSGFNFTTVL